LRPPVTVRVAKRRLWLVRPRSILILICAAVAAWFVADRLWIRGNGIVAGELTAHSPIVQARLQRLFVKCLDHVTRGQRLAEFVNEAVMQTADQQVQQLELQLAQTRAEIDIADREAETAHKLVDAQDALLQQQVAVLRAEDELKQQKFVADLVWQQAKAAVDRADAEKRAAEFVYETKRADQKMAEVNVGILERRIESYKNSPELTGHFFITAAKDGVVTECTSREGEVIAARAPIFSIFNPNDTYAVVFFSPSDVPRLARGQTFDIHVDGVSKAVKAKVTDFYPELSALPGSLTRFFWQREMWSQYTPVRLDFVDMDPEQQAKLFAWAQLSVSHWDGWDEARVMVLATNSWDWARRNILGAWQFVASSLALATNSWDWARRNILGAWQFVAPSLAQHS
jgi:multidrug resistance efflux pump